ncbi:MAG: ATP phosphoribosyltransferase regulatory subunit [Candidatus Pelagibacter sp.]|jgi:ATP phosphoribosyltransferase regulatory subunit|nr:ATP phosphoribosyltransferase regulatory subunit [Candidatus Pelagibacter sp.]|tara:strand:+ start:22 stop:1074 length:1053 start_codon:yes stop_codon:yes gene_type:complete
MKSKNYSEKIINVFRKDGFTLSEPDVLLDSEYIIQRSGENFRKLMLTFEDETGKSMCLRPDLTVASCIKYLKENSKATSRIFYSGQAYRRSSNPKEKIINDQLGIEIIGSKKKAIDDEKVLKTILKSIDKTKIGNITIKVGDVSLFEKLIESLGIPERWKMRLKRHFWRPQYFEDLLNRLETNSDVDPMAIDLDNKKFSEMKNFDQNSEIANRRVSEILSRFDRKMKDPRSFSENKEIVKIIREFLKINCSIDKIEKILKDFIKKYKLSKNILSDLTVIKNLSKISYKTIFSTNFGRDIEYYTGMVFEIYNSSKKEVARGGRYDGLLKSLGSKKNTSAVGAAINLNNLKK